MGFWRRGAVIWLCTWALTPAQGSPYSDFNAGVAANNWKHCDIAIARMTSALSMPGLLDNLKVPALIVRAQCRARDKNYEGAAADLDAALALKPDDYDAHMYRGSVRMVLKESAVAEQDFDALIRIRPDLATGRILLARYYLAEKRFDAAIEQYTVMVGDDDVFGYVLRAKAYFMHGDLDRALADANYLVGIGPKQPLAHLTREVIYEARGDFSHALSDINEAMDDGADGPEQERQKGVVLWKMGRFSDAGDSFRRAIKGDPKSGYNLMWLNLSRLDDDEPDRELAARAAAVDPSAWPGPLLAVYTGQSTPDAALKAAAAGDADDLDRNACEADFYIGAWDVHHDAKDAGRALLEQAVKDCPADYVEGYAASVELKRMK